MYIKQEKMLISIYLYNIPVMHCARIFLLVDLHQTDTIYDIIPETLKGGRSECIYPAIRLRLLSIVAASYLVAITVVLARGDDKVG